MINWPRLYGPGGLVTGSQNNTSGGAAPVATTTQTYHIAGSGVWVDPQDGYTTQLPGSTITNRST